MSVNSGKTEYKWMRYNASMILTSRRPTGKYCSMVCGSYTVGDRFRIPLLSYKKYQIRQRMRCTSKLQCQRCKLREWRICIFLDEGSFWEQGWRKFGWRKRRPLQQRGRLRQCQRDSIRCCRLEMWWWPTWERWRSRWYWWCRMLGCWRRTRSTWGWRWAGRGRLCWPEGLQCCPHRRFLPTVCKWAKSREIPRRASWKTQLGHRVSWQVDSG